MVLYILRTNLSALLVLLCGVSWAMAQEPIAPPSLPHNAPGWLDMLIKMSPFILGVVAPYGNDVMKTGLPKIFARVPVPIIMMISSILSMIASGTTAYVSGLALENQGGVTPEVAITETGATSALAHKVSQKEPTVTVAQQEQTPS